MLKFSNSAQATFLMSIWATLRFPYGIYSRKFLFPSSFLIRLRYTLTITAPSFKCKFTFLPKKDLALFKLKVSILNFTTQHLFLLCHSNNVCRWEVFLPWWVCIVWCFRFCSYFSRGSYNAPTRYPPSVSNSVWLKLHLRRTKKLLTATAEGSVKVKFIRKLS